MHRAVLSAACLLSLALSASPSSAGKAEDAFLAGLAGSWVGTGSITGGINGPMTCSLSFQQTHAGTHFSGRCTVQGMGGQSFSGDLAYNDAAHRYEAGSPGETPVIGAKKGKSVVFVTETDSLAGTGTSTMTVSATKISIDTRIDASSMRGPSKSHVSFVRQG
jgi:hypothetical protein